MSQPEYVYVSFKSNWADEFDVIGYSVMSKDEWDKELAYAQEYFKEIPTFSISAGSNQGIVFEGYDQWASCFKETSIDNITAKELIAINHGWNDSCSYGKFPTISEYGVDLDSYREEKAREEAENNKTDEQKNQEILDEMKSLPLITDSRQRYLDMYRLKYYQDLLVRTPTEEAIMNEYYRILGIPRT